MKMLLPLLSLFASLHAGATVVKNYQVQKFPGKVTIEADINFNTPTGKELDVLFVVDNSGSMEAHQRNLAASSSWIDTTLSKMQRDFHLGVITTSAEGYPGQKKTPGVLSGTPAIVTSKDMPGALARNLIVGTDGDANEMPFESVRLALSEPNLNGANKGFLRDTAPLVLVFLTDAEDQSYISANDFKNFLASTKRDISKVTAFSWIVPSSGSTNCDRDDFNATPQKIEDLTKSLGGEVYNLCEMNTLKIQDFTQKLAAFGLNNTPGEPIADFSEIPLTAQPVVSSIEVHYGSQVLTAGDLTAGWVYDASKNAVVLGSKIVWSQQPAGTKLVVSFVPEAWTK